MNKSYQTKLMAACLAVKPIRGNYTGQTELEATDVVQKAATSDAHPKTYIARDACAMLEAIKGRSLTQEEVKGIIMSLV